MCVIVCVCVGGWGGCEVVANNGESSRTTTTATTKKKKERKKRKKEMGWLVGLGWVVGGWGAVVTNSCDRVEPPPLPPKQNKTQTKNKTNKTKTKKKEGRGGGVWGGGGGKTKSDRLPQLLILQSRICSLQSRTLSREDIFTPTA